MHQNNNIKRNTSMKRNYNELFQTKVEDYDDLENHIINSINKIKNRNILLKKLFYASISAISLLSLVYLSKLIINIFISSGIPEYLSLIFLNLETLIYWKEWFYSIIESVPYLELSILLGFVSLFIWSLRKITRIQLINKYGIKIIY